MYAKRTLLLPLAAVALAGCQTWGPTWSEVTGRRYDVVTMNTAPMVINLIDGNGSFPNTPGTPIWITPGKHRISATAVPLSGGWTGGTDLVEFELDAQPCKRYFIVARYENPLGPSWTPFVDEIQTIAGCKLPDAATAPAGTPAK
jgi:hypothetical protein